MRIWSHGGRRTFEGQFTLTCLSEFLFLWETIQDKLVVHLDLLILRSERLPMTTQISKLAQHLHVLVDLLIALIDLRIFDSDNFICVREEVLSSLEIQRSFVELVLKLASSFRLLFESELMLLNIALELKNSLFSVFKVSLFLIHFFNEFIVLGLVDPQQILLMTSLPLLLFELPLLVINALVRSVKLNSESFHLFIFLIDLLQKTIILLFE